MTRLQRAMEELAGRGTPRGADAVLRAALDEVGGMRPAADDQPGPRRRTVAALAVAAAAVVAVVAGVLVATGDDDDDTVPVASDDGTDTTVTTTTAPERTTTTEEGADDVDAVDVPVAWVGHQEGGRLVVLDTETGEELRVLHEADDPDDFGDGTGEPFAAGSFLGDLALTPDGSTVYFDLCCEPAPGRIMRVPSAGGEPGEVGYGYYPAVSPDGSTLAVVEMQWLTLIDVDTEEVTRLEWDSEDDPHSMSGPAWSPDGRQLVFERHEGDGAAILLLDLDTARSLDDARPVGELATADSTVTLPVFDRRGRLHVVRQPRTALEVEVDRAEGDPPAEEAAEALVVDPDTGEVLSSDPLPSAVADQSFDASGTHLLRTYVDGTVRVHTDGGGEGEVLGSGFWAAAWS